MATQQKEVEARSLEEVEGVPQEEGSESGSKDDTEEQDVIGDEGSATEEGD